MHDNTAGILNYRGSGVQNTCRIFSPYHSGVENTCRIFMQYPSVVQNTCRIVMSHLSAVGNTGLLSQLRCVPSCRGATAYAPQTASRGRITVMLWAVFGDGSWKYEYVFRAGYTPYIKIRTRFRHLRVAFVGRMQYAPTAGYTCWFGI